LAGNPPVRRPVHVDKYSPAYKNEAFALWYKMGKCGASMLYAALPPNESGDVPSVNTVQGWITQDFISWGDALDLQVRAKMDEYLVQEKVQMLRDHTKIAREMQDMALEYLRANKEFLKVPNAVRMLVEGIRIDRESRGIPDMLEKLADRSDDELMKELQDIYSRATPVLEPITDDEE
jgi:uncharacterized protein YeeX (DUF496 family)